MTHYDETTPQLWKLPLRDEIVPRLSIVAPRGGYLVPAAHAAWVGGKLALHGIEFRKLDAALPRSEEHTSELQSLMRISYAVFFLKKKKTTDKNRDHTDN